MNPSLDIKPFRMIAFVQACKCEATSEHLLMISCSQNDERHREDADSVTFASIIIPLRISSYVSTFEWLSSTWLLLATWTGPHRTALCLSFVQHADRMALEKKYSMLHASSIRASN